MLGMSQDNSVSEVTCNRLEDRRPDLQWGRDFSLNHRVHTSSEVHPIQCPEKKGAAARQRPSSTSPRLGKVDFYLNTTLLFIVFLVWC